MKKYLSLIGITALILVIGRLGYQAFFTYLGEHTYYISMLSSGQNRGIFISALICSLIPIWYLFIASKIKTWKAIMWFVIGAWIFWLIHSNIKWDPIWFGHIITIFNTALLVCLWIYLILWFSAIWSWIERKWIKFNQFRRQEIFLTFWIGFCSFVVLVQILLWIWILYWIVSWVLFLWLGFMVRYERKQLQKWWEIIWNILEWFKAWIVSWNWNLNSKDFWNWKKIRFLVMLLPVILSVAYLYMWIQNAFIPYSTAWDANHEYMYIPKILAENAGIYRWNTIANNIPWFWHQFLTFIFSLTWCTNWWFGLSPDNIAVSMNNLSATLVLLFWIAILFQIFSLINTKKEKVEDKKSELKKWEKDNITETGMWNYNGIAMWWYFLLLRLTSWMWAFLVIVDNKTDLWVMALSLLALLAGLIFLQSRNTSINKKEILKYVIIAWLFFGFATLAKITAFVDLVLFGLLLIWLRFSSLTSLWLWIMVMWFVRKFNILTSSVMLSDEIATWLIIIWWIVTVIWLILHLLKNANRKNFLKDIRDLIILGICFIIPLIILKLPRVTISQIKSNTYSVWYSLRGVFLWMNKQDDDVDNNKFLAQIMGIENIDEINQVSDTDTINSIEEQNDIDISSLNPKKDESFGQCYSNGNIYSEDELNEWLQQIIWWQWWEDLWRYIWYGWHEFKKIKIIKYEANWTGNQKTFNFFKSLWPQLAWDKLVNNLTEDQQSYIMRLWQSSIDEDSIVFDSNSAYRLLKKLWPTSETCYGFNHDAKMLCNNADAIDNFRIDDLRTIYDNWINNKEWEAGLLLKAAIDAYNNAKSEWKLGFWATNTTLFHDEIVNLRQYYQSHSISSTEESINIPYRYLVPLNISFNWSLQNLSSYYTDTWFLWIIVYVLLLIALPYAIIKKDKILTAVAITTLIGRWIWRIIWSAILWYGTVLISRTMVTLTLFWTKILQKDENSNLKIIPWILIALVWILFWIQIIFNFIRISSQWANSVFVRYKWNVGSVQVINDNLETTNSKWEPITKKLYGYWWKNIFDLQFAHYNPIIKALADRKDEDGVIVAWTYIQYFLWNQRNVKSDWMLMDFWRKTSDWNLCKTYRRLRNDNTRYLIIDPNIWSVTMWEWNETLFYRFFGKLNGDKTKIEKDWTITTLVRLTQDWYLNLISTNNIWAKYAFIVDDDTIRNYFGEDLTDEELILTRWKMAILQYFDDANSIFSSIAWIFLSRIMNDTKWWIEDLANIYWMEIDSDNVARIAREYLNWQASEWFVKDLSQNERTILITYLNLYLSYQQSWEKWVSSMISSLLSTSMTSWSQIIALELN